MWKVTGFLVLFAPVVAQAQATIVNGSFETPVQSPGGFTYTPTGGTWTFTYPSGIAAAGSPFAATAVDGSQVAFVQYQTAAETGSVAEVGSFSETVTGLTPGQAYTITFDAADRSGYAGDPVDVNFGGVDLGTTTPGSTSWVSYTTAAYVATGTSALLTFSATYGSGTEEDAVIDAVSLSSTVVPEPASMLLLSAGVAGIVATRRRTAASA